jgi:hypothetical protein
MMAQSPTDTRLASLGLLLGAGMIGYSYWHSRTGAGPLAAPGAPGSGQSGTPVAGGRSLADLQQFADTNRLRLQTSVDSPGDYALIPQPGYTFDPGLLSQQATQQGFQSSVSGGFAHVSVPYTGQ